MCKQDFAEAIAQLAMFSPGREALLLDSSVVQALQQVVTQGWTDEARLSAESALVAMSDRQPVEGREEHRAHDQKHVMLSYQWGVQETVKRIKNELQARGYLTWFGALSSREATYLVLGVLDAAAASLTCARVNAAQTWIT